MNAIEKWVDRKLRRIAWKHTIKDKKETKSKKKECEYKNNLKVSFEEYKNQPEGELENLQHISTQKQIQQGENAER